MTKIVSTYGISLLPAKPEDPNFIQEVKEHFFSTKHPRVYVDFTFDLSSLEQKKLRPGDWPLDGTGDSMPLWEGL